jgi:hypothetical protein
MYAFYCTSYFRLHKIEGMDAKLDVSPVINTLLGASEIPTGSFCLEYE